MSYVELKAFVSDALGDRYLFNIDDRSIEVFDKDGNGIIEALMGDEIYLHAQDAPTDSGLGPYYAGTEEVLTWNCERTSCTPYPGTGYLYTGGSLFDAYAEDINPVMQEFHRSLPSQLEKEGEESRRMECHAVLLKEYSRRPIMRVMYAKSLNLRFRIGAEDIQRFIIDNLPCYEQTGFSYILNGINVSISEASPHSLLNYFQKGCRAVFDPSNNCLPSPTE